MLVVVEVENQDYRKTMRSWQFSKAQNSGVILGGYNLECRKLVLEIHEKSRRSMNAASPPLRDLTSWHQTS